MPNFLILGSFWPLYPTKKVQKKEGDVLGPLKSQRLSTNIFELLKGSETTIFGSILKIWILRFFWRPVTNIISGPVTRISNWQDYNQRLKGNNCLCHCNSSCHCHCLCILSLSLCYSGYCPPQDCLRWLGGWVSQNVKIRHLSRMPKKSEHTLSEEIILDEIRLRGRATINVGLLWNMSHCRLNWHMIVTTIMA